MQLHVKALNATNLPAMDLNGLCDPYLILQINGQPEQKTFIKEKTKDPEWNQAFVFEILDKESAVLTVKLYDNDKLTKDDIIDQFTYEVAQLADGAINTEAHKLKRPKGAKRSPVVNMMYQLLPYGQEPWQGEAPPPAEVEGEKEKKKKKKHHKKAPKSGLEDEDSRPKRQPTGLQYGNLLCYLKVVEAKDVDDIDSFARVSYGKANPINTETIPKCSNPTYNRIFALKVKDLEESKLRIDIMKKGLLGEETFGYVEIPPGDIIPGSPVDKWFFLKNADGKGQIHLVIHTARETDEMFVENLFQILHLDLAIISARGVPKADVVGKSDPYVVARLSGSYTQHATKWINNTDSPVWNESFDIAIPNVVDGVLHLDLYDHDDVSKDDKIATYDISLYDLVVDQVVDTEVEMVLQPKMGPSAPYLHIKYKLYPAPNPAMGMKRINQEVKVSHFVEEYESYSGNTPSLSTKPESSSVHSLSPWNSEDAKAESLSPIRRHRRKVRKAQIEASTETTEYTPAPDQLLFHIKVLDAKVKAADINGKSDSYVVCEINNQKVKTPAIQNTLTPAWEDQVFHLNIMDVENDKCVVTVWDEDPLKDDNLGFVVFDIDQMAPGPVLDEEFDLKDKKGKVQGKIHLVAQIAHSGHPPFDPYEIEYAVVNVHVIECRDVQKMDVVGQSDPYVKIGLKDYPLEYKTKVIDNTANPVWNEQFVIKLTNPQFDVLRLELYDQDDVSKDDGISFLDINLSRFRMGEVVEDTWNMTPFGGIKKPGKMHLRLQIAPQSHPAFEPADF